MSRKLKSGDFKNPEDLRGKGIKRENNPHIFDKGKGKSGIMEMGDERRTTRLSSMRVKKLSRMTRSSFVEEETPTPAKNI